MAHQLPAKPGQKALIIWSMSEGQSDVLAMREDLKSKVGGEVALEVFERVKDGEFCRVHPRLEPPELQLYTDDVFMSGVAWVPSVDLERRLGFRPFSLRGPSF